MKVPALLMALLVSSCAQPTSLRTSEVELEGASVTEQGITIHFDETTMFRSVTTTRGRESSSESTVNGLPYEFDGTTLRLGSLVLTDFEPGDEIRLSTSGIFVNGVKRADFPTD
jgi:hypothetical protein